MVVLKFRGSAHFRHRIICSTLSGKSVRIYDIRAEFEEPGLTDFEVSYLRLIDKITNGTIVEINETGTEVYYRPGVLIGGKVNHTCPESRSISYFLEGILHLAPFMKKPLNITFTGVTNSNEDVSVDVIRTVYLPLLKHFGVSEEGLDLRVLKRGAPPKGGGQVQFTCPIVQELTPILLVDEGQIVKVRGIAYCTRVSPQVSNRLVDSAKAALKPYINNVFINTDHYKGAESGLSAGFGLTLVAESSSGAQLAAEAMANPGDLPEDLAALTTKLLLEEIFKGGFVDTASQSLMLLFMALGPEDVSKIRTGKLSLYTIGLLRHIKDFFGVKFKISTDRETQTVLLSCLGLGYKNYHRKVW